MALLFDISVGSVYHIIHDELKFQKLCARWVPKRLTPEMRDMSMLVKRFCVGMMGIVKHFSSESSLGMRDSYTSMSRNENPGVVPHLVPKPEEGAGATICRQSHVDFLLRLQEDDLRALHAQRKHCGQCHLLNPSEGKCEARYSPETARVVDDDSDYSTKMRSQMLQQQCQLLRSCYLSAYHTLRTHRTSRRRIFTSSVH